VTRCDPAKLESRPAENGLTYWRCPECDSEARFRSTDPQRIHMTCGGWPGPGTYLVRLLKELGVPPLGCGCKTVAAKMNRGGVKWCAAHRGELEAELVEASIHWGNEPAWLVSEAIRAAVER
jgi:hypothetical protein